MRDPRRVSSQTWLESTELFTIWSHGMTGDGGWNTSVFAMAAPIPHAAALMASASAAAVKQTDRYEPGALAQSLPALGRVEIPPFREPLPLLS